TAGPAGPADGRTAIDVATELSLDDGVAASAAGATGAACPARPAGDGAVSHAGAAVEVFGCAEASDAAVAAEAAAGPPSSARSGEVADGAAIAGLNDARCAGTAVAAGS